MPRWPSPGREPAPFSFPENQRCTPLPGVSLLNHSRYLPDRRDLNRSFPGSEKGSLAARLAHLFMQEIVEKFDVKIVIQGIIRQLGVDLSEISSAREGGSDNLLVECLPLRSLPKLR